MKKFLGGGLEDPLNQGISVCVCRATIDGEMHGHYIEFDGDVKDTTIRSQARRQVLKEFEAIMAGSDIYTLEIYFKSL